MSQQIQLLHGNLLDLNWANLWNGPLCLQAQQHHFDQLRCSLLAFNILQFGGTFRDGPCQGIKFRLGCRQLNCHCCHHCGWLGQLKSTRLCNRWNWAFHFGSRSFFNFIRWRNLLLFHNSRVLCLLFRHQRVEHKDKTKSTFEFDTWSRLSRFTNLNSFSRKSDFKRKPIFNSMKSNNLEKNHKIKTNTSPEISKSNRSSRNLWPQVSVRLVQNQNLMLKGFHLNLAMPVSTFKRETLFCSSDISLHQRKPTQHSRSTKAIGKPAH